MMTEFRTGRVRRVAVLLGAAVLSLALGGVAAQGLKKYVTPDGRTIYSDTPVPGAQLVGEVKPPPPRNPEEVAGARAREAQRSEEANRLIEERLKAREEDRNLVESARAKLEQAKRQLEAGRAPKPGERIGTAGGGTRFSDEYLARQRANEQAVKQAEEDLQKALAR